MVTAYRVYKAPSQIHVILAEEECVCSYWPHMTEAQECWLMARLQNEGAMQVLHAKYIWHGAGVCLTVSKYCMVSVSDTLWHFEVNYGHISSKIFCAWTFTKRSRWFKPKNVLYFITASKTQREKMICCTSTKWCQLKQTHTEWQ